MVGGARPPLLVVRHVSWEGPHRIVDAFEGLTRCDERCVLDGDSLPAIDAVAGAVFMGGPMNVDEVERYPGLLAEREWIARAHSAGLPILGVCLGAQLIARALGSTVRTGAAPEIGWGEVEVHESRDGVIGPLAPATSVLHWHGDVFDLPAGATLLASSKQTPVQAFRRGNTIGMLFHAEADAELVDHWLGEPVMAQEAEDAIGADYRDRLMADTERMGPVLAERSRDVFAAFARIVAGA